MSSGVSYGYTRPSGSGIEIQQFSVFVDDQEYNALSTELPTWDYESTVRIAAEVYVDLKKVTQEAGFDLAAQDSELPEFSILASWSANKTRQRGASPRQTLKQGVNLIAHEIRNDLLGGELHVTLQVDLISSGTPSQGAVVATKQGARLWTSEVLRVRLEGNSAQMTLIPLNFSDSRIEPRNAMWKVEVSRELLRPVQSGLRVYINTNHPMSLRMLEKTSGKEKTLWNSYLQAEIVAQMLLNSDALTEIEDLADNPLFPGSLGESILNLAQSLFPRTPFEDIPADPPVVFATAQALAFRDVK